MSWEQFLGWIKYSTLEPFGEERADLRMGQICATIANFNTDLRKRKPYRATDFTFKFGVDESGKKSPMTGDEWKQLKSAARSKAVAEQEAAKRKKERAQRRREKVLRDREEKRLRALERAKTVR